MNIFRELYQTSFLHLITFFLLLVCYPSASDALFEGCDHNYNVNAGYTYLESPYYPQYYPASTSCRYTFTAPLDYGIQINCTIDLNKNSNGCSTEYFYVATDGDAQLRGAESFCGLRTVVRQSLFESITLAYVSYGSYGRFQCQLYTYPQPCDCGWSVNTKIVNGQETSINEYPSVVALYDRTKSVSSFCGASIVSHRYILTAAHCTELQPQASNIVAYVGDHDLSSGSETRYAASYLIQQIIPHPGYIADPVNNDIALLLTTQNIKWSRGVGPICLPPPSQASNSFAYFYADIIGWGTTSFGGPTSRVLRKINLQIASNDACKKSYEGTTTIYPTQICTYDYQGKGRDSCQYDSGGPVIYRGSRQFLLGIISFGKVCGTDGYSMGVNTRMTSYMNWIRQYISTCDFAM